VSCDLGKLYNKDAVIEFLLDRSAFGDGEDICGHIRSLKVSDSLWVLKFSHMLYLKDVKTLSLTPNPAPKSDSPNSTVDRGLFVCPLNFKEMTGAATFVYLSTCGCVFSQAGLKAVSSSTPPSEKGKDNGGVGGEGYVPSSDGGQLEVCPQCATKYDRTGDVRILNPGAEEEERMRDAMERRVVAAASVKGKGKKRKAVADGAEGDQPGGKKRHGSGSASPAPSLGPTVTAATSRAVASSLAMEEAKRKAHMSEAVKSLYRPKDGKARKETFMTMGTFTRVSRSN
jgi:Rtf2 RING-finger